MGVRKDLSKNKKQWLAEYYFEGKRVRRYFLSKGEAVEHFNRISRLNDPFVKRAIIEKPASEHLSDLVHLWYKLHGNTLISGKAYLGYLLNICQHFGDPLAIHFKAEKFAEYRTARLDGAAFNGLDLPKISASSLNFYLTIFKGVFNELIRLEKWNGENPLRNLRPLKTKELELRFLDKDEIARLLDACGDNHKLRLAVVFCLSTGARWGEMLSLTRSRVIPYKVTFTKTKSGKNRTIPISQDLYNALLAVERFDIFHGIYDKQLAKALTSAGIKLRDNQLTHVLRHTFASHFMMNGGNILVLKDILGHSDINMTMIYAHFSPDHLETAVTLNPISNINLPPKI